MPLKAISLYTGADGLDLDLESAGFQMFGAIELDEYCVETLRTNRDWPLINRSTHEVSSSELLETARLEPGEADLLFGGLPWQPFSKTDYWASGDSRRLDDPRADTVAAYLRVLRDSRPHAFLMEDVAGLAFRRKDERLHLNLQGLRSINEICGTDYLASLLVLNAADFGVPQLRQRAFSIGARDGSHFGELAPTHRRAASAIQGDLDLPESEAPYLDSSTHTCSQGQARKELWRE